MRVAIVHDYIKEYGGAERVLESLHSVFPKAPVYTLVYLQGYLGPHRSRFENWDIRTSWVQNLPFKAKLISPLRLVAPLLFGQFDFSKFDVVIVSATGAYSPNLIKKGNAIQICYSHTPPRYLYGYETARNWRKNIITRVIGGISIHFLRMVDYKSAQNVDYFIANSEETKRRIQKFYRKDATVIYPPVEIKSLASVSSSPSVSSNGGRQSIRASKTLGQDSYYLAGGRIARAKHTDLIINTFIRNGLPLKVFGKGFAGFESELKKIILRANERESRSKGKFSTRRVPDGNPSSSNNNIEFLGEVTDEEKDELMMNAKAFVFASEDEDFGIVPVEAMMSGTPVIAHRSGGVLETVIEGKTGLFFDEFTIESLNAAIKKFNDLNHQSMRENCIKQARKFGKERFEKEIKEFVDKKIR